MPKPPADLREFKSLVQVVESLRGPDGCPWDKEQTHQTLTRFAIEEAHELSEAIDTGRPELIRDELGDVLLQVILNSEIARQDGQFDVYDVIQNLNEKMIRRHPHVFADVKVGSSDEVLSNWTDIKAAEKGGDKAASKPLSFDIPMGLPALLRAQKIGEKTTRVGFDWGSAEECWEKVAEEFGELREALTDYGKNTNPTRGTSGDSARRDAVESELGDLLFSLAQLARHLQMDSEQALRKTNTRFEVRFRKMQELVRAAGKDWGTLPAGEKEVYWKRAKPS
jgi:tetrapyrrole methylase family protein/MazG family protein